MRANELMVNNIIAINDGRTAKVYKVDRDGIFGIVTDFVGLIEIPFKYLKPIPITEEWLTKNDFKKEYSPIVECYSYKRLFDGYYVDIQFGCSNMGDEYVNCHIDNCSRCTVASADIQYVHQLQNILNIMNIKFDIKL